MTTSAPSVTDIARFSLNDGPGIRTTVFLKGCPLRCIWCHNPENIDPKTRLMFNESLCTGCGKCVSACPNGAISLSGNKTTTDRAKCTDCGLCANICPTGARKLAGKAYSVEELLAVVQKDRRYYDKSGGGLTVSGGEPMLFPDFTKQLLSAVKEAGIHTAVETCGYAETSAYAELLPVCDLFLFDYKETDPALHRKFTGKDNMLILKNLDFICNNGATVILRCPVIPGLNDRPEHFEAIAALSKRYVQIKGVELMAYHKMGVSKRDLYGLSAGFSAGEPDQTEKGGWIAQLKALGCVATLG